MAVRTLEALDNGIMTSVSVGMVMFVFIHGLSLWSQ
jgi:hypothetical protein